MSDKARLLQEADETFSELRQAVDGLDDARLTRVWLGSWSVREILIHINNPNPMLLDDSPERAAVEPAGLEVGRDGMRFDV